MGTLGSINMDPLSGDWVVTLKHHLEPEAREYRFSTEDLMVLDTMIQPELKAYGVR
jgi:hypothetical protein